MTGTARAKDANRETTLANEQQGGLLFFIYMGLYKEARTV